MSPALLAGRRILFVFTGGAAVIRALEIARAWAKAGAQLSAIFTRAATQLASPLAFEALTGGQAHTALWDATEPFPHIRLAREAEVILVAPATADFLARLAAGIADDLATATILAARCPVVLAPAMNAAMWQSPATQQNLATLRARGFIIATPETGTLACGEEGPGRLAPEGALRLALVRALSGEPLMGRRIVVTGGRTEEPWDAVRVITNRASGRMGAALAEAAAGMGAEVVFLQGTGAPAPAGARVVATPTAEAMHQAAMQEAQGADAFLAAAAVADHRPLVVRAGKPAKRDADLLVLAPAPDVLAAVAGMKARPHFVLGFALEAEDPVARARKKMQKKGCNAMIANTPANLGADEATGWWVDARKSEAIPRMDKARFAWEVLQRVARHVR